VKIKVIATTNGATCKCTVEDVFEWLLEQVRIKVLAVPVGPGERQTRGATASGHAPAADVVRIPINSGNDLTTFLRRYAENPNRRFLFTFPKLRLAGEVYLHGTIPKAKKARVEPSAWTIMYPSGKYETVAEHLEAMVEALKEDELFPAGDKGEARAIFGDLLRLLRGKWTGSFGLDYFDQADDLNKALSCVVVIAGSEGTRCLGMLAGAIMAITVLKYGKSDVDMMFRQGGWPAVGAKTEKMLRKIDKFYFEKSQPLGPPPQTLPAEALEVETRFKKLLKLYCETMLERDAVPRKGGAKQPVYWGFTGDATLLQEVKNLLTSRILNHI